MAHISSLYLGKLLHSPFVPSTISEKMEKATHTRALGSQGLDSVVVVVDF